jgi:hypothetical protein
MWFGAKGGLPDTPLGSPLDSASKDFRASNAIETWCFDRYKIDYNARLMGRFILIIH